MKVKPYLELYKRTYDEAVGTRWELMQVEFTQFPAGEVQVANYLELEQGSGKEYQILVSAADPLTIISARILADFIKTALSAKVHIDAPYLPASRSDRGSVATVATYHSILSPDGDIISTVDTHNPAVARIFNIGIDDSIFRAVLPKTELRNNKYSAIIAPDKGAEDRAQLVGRALSVDIVRVCVKTRDFDTGKITGLEVPELDPAKRYLVVDDICDGGSTFMHLASQLNIPKENLDLWVTHGVFSGNWYYNIMPWYGTVYTTNSLVSAEHAKIQAAFTDHAASRIHITDIRPLMIGELK